MTRFIKFFPVGGFVDYEIQPGVFVKAEILGRNETNGCYYCRYSSGESGVGDGLIDSHNLFDPAERPHGRPSNQENNLTAPSGHVGSSESSPSYFVLDDTMYDADLIETLRLDGGPDGFGCWGQIKLRGWDESKTIGDGSYYMDDGHVKHLCAHDFGFKTLRAIMKARGRAN